MLPTLLAEAPCNVGAAWDIHFNAGSGKMSAPRLGAYCYPQNALGRGLAGAGSIGQQARDLGRRPTTVATAI